MSKLDVDLTKHRGKRRMKDIAAEIGLSASTVCRAELGLKVSPASSRLIRTWLSAEDARNAAGDSQRQCKPKSIYAAWDEWAALNKVNDKLQDCSVPQSTQPDKLRLKPTQDKASKSRKVPRSDTSMIIASYWITVVNLLAAVAVISIVLSRAG